MNNSTYHEAVQRGTPDFPAELYHINGLHPRYQMQAHWHSDFELIRVLSGELSVFLNESRRTLVAGDAVFIPGGIIHSAAAHECEYECIVFSPALLYTSAQCRQTVKQYIRSCVFFRDNGIVEGIFAAMKSDVRGREFMFLSEIYALVGTVLSEKSDAAPLHSQSGKAEKLKAALSFIEENYATRFSLAELAHSCAMSPNYFCRFFKEAAQKTPFDYINEFRINIACERIAHSNESITEIAYGCGFCDLSYFIKIFKKYKGISPKLYKKTMEEKQYANQSSYCNVGRC